jgi:hypothetical protein
MDEIGLPMGQKGSGEPQHYGLESDKSMQAYNTNEQVTEIAK